MKTKRRTYGQIYTDRINVAKTDDEILAAYEEIKKEDPDYYKHNLGYMLGYFDSAMREKWYGLLSDVSHPIFGPGFGRGKDSTPEEAFNKGVEIASSPPPAPRSEVDDDKV